MLRFACPGCGKVYKAEDSLSGKSTVCKACGLRFILPEATIQEVHYDQVLPPEDREIFSNLGSWEVDGSDSEIDLEDHLPERNVPDKVTAIGGMLLGGGIWTIINIVLCAIVFLPCCLWPGLWFGFVWAILAITRGVEILNNRPYVQSPRTLITLQILQAINFDMINVIMGIMGLVFINDSQIETFFRRKQR